MFDSILPKAIISEDEARRVSLIAAEHFEAVENRHGIKGCVVDGVIYITGSMTLREAQLSRRF